jgi:hypothetical protein
MPFFSVTYIPSFARPGACRLAIAEPHDDDDDDDEQHVSLLMPLLLNCPFL